MTLGVLKKSLSRFPPDMNDLEVVIASLDEITNEKDYDILCFVGYSQNIPCLLIGGEKITKQLIKEKTPGLDGKPIQLPPEAGEEWKSQ